MTDFIVWLLNINLVEKEPLFAQSNCLIRHGKYKLVQIRLRTPHRYKQRLEQVNKIGSYSKMHQFACVLCDAKCAFGCAYYHSSMPGITP